MFEPNSGHNGVCTNCFYTCWIVYKLGETELCEACRQKLKTVYSNEKQFNLVIPAVPMGKERAKQGKHGMYTPERTVRYENMLKDLYYTKYKNTVFFTGEDLIVARMVIYLPVANSLSDKKKALLYGQYCGKKPDIDNALKITWDALNNLAWKDDCLIVDSWARKFYVSSDSDAPRTVAFFGLAGDPHTL